MRARRLPVILLVSILGASCDPSTTGPTDPARANEVSVDDGAKASGARHAARRFVDAYAQAGEDGGNGLEAIVGTRLLRSWVHWLQVQHEQFPGTVSGTVDSTDIGPAVPIEVEGVPGSAEVLRQVDVRATVLFSYVPEEGEAFTSTRSLDGPMRLVREASGAWSVLDFTRDGIPLSRQFEKVQGAVALDEGVGVSVLSFTAAPIWQFGLVVSTDETATLSPDSVTLTDADGTPVASARAVTNSLARIRGGSTVQGLVTFQPQASAAGLSLRFELRGAGERSTIIQIPLADRIHPIPLEATSPAPAG
jgi:hypothetical protein